MSETLTEWKRGREGMDGEERAELFLKELIQAKQERGITYSFDPDKTPRDQIEEIWRDEVTRERENIVTALANATVALGSGNNKLTSEFINDAMALIDCKKSTEVMREAVRRTLWDNDMHGVGEDKEELIAEDVWELFEKRGTSVVERILAERKSRGPLEGRGSWE